MNVRELLRLDLGALVRGRVEVIPTNFRRFRKRPVSFSALVLDVLRAPFVPFLALAGLIHPRRMYQLATVTEQLSRILACNAPLVPALEAVASDAPNKAVWRALCKLNLDLARGFKLSEAMILQPRFFPKYYIDLIRAGENSGTLSAVLNNLIQMIAESQRVRGAVRRSMTYLTFLFAVCFLMTAFLAKYVIPVFLGIIKDFGGTLSYPDFLTRITDFVSYRASILLTETAAVLVLVLVLWRAGILRRVAARLGLALPFVRQMVIQSNLAHISQVLGKMLEAGYPVDEALETTAGLDVSPIFARMLGRIRQQVVQGQTVAVAAASETLLPKSFRGMLSLGEHAGNLPDSLAYMGDFYQSTVLKNCVVMTRILFPVTIVLIGCWVLTVYTFPFRAIIAIIDAMTSTM